MTGSCSNPRSVRAYASGDRRQNGRARWACSAAEHGERAPVLVRCLPSSGQQLGWRAMVECAGLHAAPPLFHFAALALPSSSSLALQISSHASHAAVSGRHEGSAGREGRGRGDTKRRQTRPDHCDSPLTARHAQFHPLLRTRGREVCRSLTTCECVGPIAVSVCRFPCSLSPISNPPSRSCLPSPPDPSIDRSFVAALSQPPSAGVSLAPRLSPEFEHAVPGAISHLALTCRR